MSIELNEVWIFSALLPIISFLYSSVGHGGASAYLALMALFSFAPNEMKSTALLLNLFVAGISFYHYYIQGFFNRKLFLSFAIASTPMAFLGGTISLNTLLYKKILGVLLIFTIFRMLNQFRGDERKIQQLAIWQGLIVGGSIGFFSGLIGIGGGIILSPVILLFHWGKMKETAAVSALFIWVNSFAGLIGQFKNGIHLQEEALFFVMLASIGAYLGGLFGSKLLSSSRLKHVLAFVLLLASIKLIIS